MLGNGISRLDYDRLILEWPGEVWGCNRVYLEYGRKLTRLTGHTDVMADALEHRREHQHNYEIWCGHLGRAEPADQRFTCPGGYRKDSGSTLVAQALHEGFDVVAVGFDFGGWDIHSPGLEHDPKQQWVKRWRAILGQYGWDRVRFIGYDHLPYLKSRVDAGKYAKRYLVGRPHLMTPEYIARWEDWTGMSAFPSPIEEVKVKIVFADGREAEVKDVIAEKMIRKGKAKPVGKAKVQEDPPKKKEPPKVGVQRKGDDD